MMTSDSLNGEFGDVTSDLQDVIQELESPDFSSDSGSEISLSEKIVLESNEKRLRQRMSSLQTSIMNLKEQLKMEKELWREDMEKIRNLQKQQEVVCTCVHNVKPVEQVKSEVLSKTSSVSTMTSSENLPKSKDDIFKNHSIKQLLELQNYKRKLAETENMCTLELTRVKQSLEDLKTLQNIAQEWGRDQGNNETEQKLNHGDTQSIHEIFVNPNHKIE